MLALVGHKTTTQIIYYVIIQKNLIRNVKVNNI